MPITAPAVKVLPALFNTVNAVDNPGGVFQLGTTLYLPVTNPCTGNTSTQNWADNVPPPLLCNARMLRSIDNGATWAEVDAANAPGVSLVNHGTNFGIVSPLSAVLKDASTIIVAYVKWDYHSLDSPVLAYSIFHMDTNLWGAETAGGPAVDAATDKLQVSYRSGDGAVIIAYQGALETVMAVLYKRIFYSINLAGGIPIDAAQTGSQLHYDLGGVVLGTAGRSHFFYTVEDPIGLTSSGQSRTLNAGNALQAIVTIAAIDLASMFPLPVAYLGNIGVSYIRGFPLGFFSTAVSADVPVFAEQALPTDLGGDNGPVFASGTGGLASASQGTQNAWANPTGLSGGWSAGTFVFTPDPAYSSTRPDVGSPISLGTGIVVSEALEAENVADPQLYFFAFGMVKRCLLS